MQTKAFVLALLGLTVSGVKLDSASNVLATPTIIYAQQEDGSAPADPAPSDPAPRDPPADEGRESRGPSQGEGEGSDAERREPSQGEGEGADGERPARSGRGEGGLDDERRGPSQGEDEGEDADDERRPRGGRGRRHGRR